MRTQKIHFLSIGVSLLLLVAIFQTATVWSQSQCAALVETLFSSLNDSCAASGGGTACFGSAASVTTVDATEAAFSAAGDTMELDNVAQVSTAPFSDEELGLAALNVYANVPLALSDKGLRYVLVGDVQVENLVAADAAVLPAETVVVSPIVGANLRVSPNADGRVLASAKVGSELPANGMSSDQQWLSVLFEGQRAWISRQTVAEKQGEISSLPVVTNADRTLMQAIKLTTTSDTTECGTALPSLLVMQGPSDFNASVTVNGADIRFGSTIVLRVLDSNLQLIVLSGSANASGVVVPPGFTVSIPLGSDGMVNGAWTGLRSITQDERNFLTALQLLPESLMYYAITVPTQEDITAILAAINTTSISNTIAGPASGKANCSTFKPTSPLSGLSFADSVPFYWDGANGANGYRLNLYDGTGNRVKSFDMTALSTTFSLNATDGGIGGGTNFAWDVEALVDGQTACTTGRVSLIRDIGNTTVSNNSEQTAPVAEPTPCLWSGC